MTGLGQWSVVREGVDYLHHNDEEAGRRLGPTLVLELAPNNLLSVPLAHTVRA